jgi:hypothetical protein
MTDDHDPRKPLAGPLDRGNGIAQHVTGYRCERGYIVTENPLGRLFEPGRARSFHQGPEKLE